MKKKMIGLMAMVAMGLLSGPAWGQEQKYQMPQSQLDGIVRDVTEIQTNLKDLKGKFKGLDTRVTKLTEAQKAAPPVVKPPSPPDHSHAPPPRADASRVVRDALAERVAVRYARVTTPHLSRTEVAVAKSHLTDVNETYCRSHPEDRELCDQAAHAERLAELRLDQNELAAVTQATIVPPPESFVETYGGQCLMGGALGVLAAGVASATAGTVRGQARNGAEDAATTGLVTAGVTGAVFAIVNILGDVDQWGGKAALAAGCAAGGGMAVAGGDKVFRPRSPQRIVVATPVR